MANTPTPLPSSLAKKPATPLPPDDILSQSVIKPTPPELVFSQMIHAALCRPDPIEELYCIREKINFEYDRAQQDFFKAFLEEERRAFALWKEADHHISEFFGCILHDGQLFENCPPSRFTQSLREDWIKLMCEELEFLQTRPVWGLDEKHLARHIGEVLIALTRVWEDRSIDIDFRLEKALSAHLASKQLRALLDDPQALSNVATLLATMVATNASGYVSLTEEVAGLIPEIYAICQKLFPDFFCVEGLESDDAHDEEEEDLSDELDSEWEEVNEHDEEAQLQQDVEDKRHWETLLDGWEGIMQHALHNTLIPPLPYHRTKMFEELCRFSPVTMIAYDAALDGLACSSETAFRDFAPYLISRAVRDPYGAVAVINIVTLPQRVFEPLSYDPREVIVSELKNLRRKERNTIFRSASRLIKAKESPFIDRAEAQDALAFLRASVKSPTKAPSERKSQRDKATE